MVRVRARVRVRVRVRDTIRVRVRDRVRLRVRLRVGGGLGIVHRRVPWDDARIRRRRDLPRVKRGTSWAITRSG